MKTCQSGRVIAKTKKGRKYFYLRLNLVDKEGGEKKYSTKDIATGLAVSKRNQAKANAMLEDAITDYSGDTERMYFHKYLEKWLESKKPSVEETTYQNYRYRVKIIVDHFADQKLLLTELRPEHIRDFYNFLMTVERGGKKGYSNCTIKDVSVVLRMALDDAVMNKYIRESPAGQVRTPKKNGSTGRKAYVGADEVGIFLEAIRDHRLEAPFLMTLYYGLRREEVLGLRWSAVHDDGRLYIEHTVTLTDRVIVKDRTKSDESCRCYPIPDEIRKKLDEIRDRQAENRRAFGNRYNESDYIFTWEDGRLYRPDYLTKSFKKLVRSNAKLDDALTLHSLRASCVSILIHSGMDIKDVQTWVGHKDVQTTLNIYARTNEKQQEKVAHTMSDTVFGNREENS